MKIYIFGVFNNLGSSFLKVTLAFDTTFEMMERFRIILIELPELQSFQFFFF